MGRLRIHVQTNLSIDFTNNNILFIDLFLIIEIHFINQALHAYLQVGVGFISWCQTYRRNIFVQLNPQFLLFLLDHLSIRLSR